MLSRLKVQSMIIALSQATRRQLVLHSEDQSMNNHVESMEIVDRLQYT